ncbi:MAG TPA: helix-turn-helix domain-containing protein [Nocardioides sp.]|nr:helix-turn-helix domain-containing protein [Nocardioides sp.]
MENSDRAVPPLTSSLGPRRGRGPGPLTAKRAAILELLVDQPEPTTLAALVEASGLHPNTVREHLDGLVAQGWVHRFRQEPSGRGRPAWLYEAVEGREQQEYAGLAAALAASIARTSPTPVATAVAAGEEWGHELARNREATPSTPTGARDEVVSLLGEIGFDPDRAAERPDLVRLRRCPLLEAAHRHRDVVCGVHMGMVRGALTEYGADPEGTALEPFAEPGACLLVVPPLPADPA